MLSNILVAPSLNSLFVTGFLLLLAVFIIVKYYKTIVKYTPYQKLVIITGFVIAIGIHGLIHLGVEKEYDFNPYKWF
jgi:hypothetical protein